MDRGYPQLRQTQGCDAFKRMKKSVHVQYFLLVIMMIASPYFSFIDNNVTQIAAWLMWATCTLYLVFGFRSQVVGPVFEHYDDCVDCEPIKAAFRENNPDEDSQG